MLLNFIDRIGEYNPQLLREIKGRIKPFSAIIAVGSSLLLQLIVFLFQLNQLPGEETKISDTYCLLSKTYQQQENILSQKINKLQAQLEAYRQIKLTDPTIIPNLEAQIKQITQQLDKLREALYKDICPVDQINWAMWWREHSEYMFLTFSVIFIFALIVGGTYLLISDLAKEEHRGTLNFIRLSPQSETNILTGKLLGVPSLVYLFVFTAIPFHFITGRSAQISTIYIFAYYTTLAASSFFFSSAALLFGLVSRLFSNFQPWLGSGVVLFFLFTTMIMASSSYSYLNNPTTVLRLLSPWDMTDYLFPNLFRYTDSAIKELQFFGLPIGQNLVSLLGFSLVNYGICSYGIWQAMKRCFRNPNTTIISKGQSYLLIAFTQVMFWGLTIAAVNDSYDLHLVSLIGFFNAALILALIFILSHQRQTIIDWARYRHQNQPHKSLWEDLIWGEKSPAILAIFINLSIAAAPAILWIIVVPSDLFNEQISKVTAFLSVALCVGLMMIYATIAQLLLLLKTQKRYVWSVGTVSALIFLPPMILQILGVYPGEAHALAWLFSTFPWAGLEYADSFTSCIVLLGQFTMIAMLNYQLNKQVKVLGESATKALLAGR